MQQKPPYEKTAYGNAICFIFNGDHHLQTIFLLQKETFGIFLGIFGKPVFANSSGLFESFSVQTLHEIYAST